MKYACTFQDFAVGVGALEPVKERVAEFGQGSELLLWIDDQRVTRDDALLVVIHDSNESEKQSIFPLKCANVQNM